MRLRPPALHQFASGVGQANTATVLQHPTAIGRPLDAIPDRAVHLVGQRPPKGFALGCVVEASHQVPNEGLSRVGHEQFWSPLQMDRGRSTLAAGADPVCYRGYFGVAVLPKNLFESSSSIAHKVGSRRARRHVLSAGAMVRPGSIG